MTDLTPLKTWSPLCVPVYTSFLLGIPALFTNILSIKTICTFLCPVSVLHHAGYYHSYVGKHAVLVTDRLLAYALAFTTTAHAAKQNQSPLTGIYWVTFSYVVLIYFVTGATHIPGTKGDIWHGTMHTACFIGLMALIATQ